ncbi:MAG: Polysaccharide biosynthesis protein [Pelotomaculum sp. PtaB.Bin104]|nr:MAG: Polysaccharide biosynthesis protein [Pelotomaculum sp. PtaB.Bin104]
MGQTTGIILGVANNIVLARLLGPANFGIYKIFLKICNVAGVLSQLGTNAVIVKLAGITAGTGDFGRLKGILHSTFRIIIISSSVIVLIIYTNAQILASKVFHSPELYTILLIGVVVIPLQNGLLLTKEAFRGLQDLKTASYLPVLQQLILLILMLFLYFRLIASIENVLFALSISIFCALAVGLFALRRITSQYLTKQVSPVSILQESLPMMITRGSLLVITSMDVFVLGIYTNSTEVGIYSVVSALAATTIFPLGTINQVIPAMIAHLNVQKDFNTLSYLVRFASTLGALFSIPFLILLIYFGKDFLYILFGPQYTSGIIAFNFLIIGQLVNCITGSCDNVLQMTGLHMVLMKISIICGLFNLVLNIYLVQHFGKEGVAAATALSLIAQNVLATIMAYKKTGILTLASINITGDIFKQARRYISTLLSH